MANALYPKWKQELIQATANTALTGTVKVALVQITGGGTPYTYSSSHQFYSDLSGVINSDQTIGSHTYINGTFSGANVTFLSVSGANVVGALVIYISTGVAGTSPLVCYLDTNITGIPFTPSGGDVQITWDAAGIFTL